MTQRLALVFKSGPDLVKGVLFYLNQPKNSESRLRRQQKLHEISAEVFVEKVVQFYQDCQKDMAVHDELNQAEKSHRLFHRPRS
jgi:1,2-diacylglycerol 3-alpha-glucosyltransferase